MNDQIKTIFVSGKMTGLPGYNHTAFHQVTAQLRAQGYTVLNPAEIAGGDTTLPRAHYLRECLRMVADADAIVVLPNWRDSKGARQEVFNGLEIGIPILDLNLMPVSETICQEADRIVSSDRQDSYGHPASDFSRTALMWTGLFRDKLKVGAEFVPSDIPLAMICVKLSRLANTYKRDSVVDIAGYAKTADMCHEPIQQ